MVSGLATALAVAFGLVVALWSVGLRWRRLVVAVSVVALVMPPFLVTNCWLHFLGHTGVWRKWLPFDIFSLGGTVWILALLIWPVTFLLVSSAWHRLEPAQLETDPALSGWPFIRVLLWPLARPALGMAAALTFVLALGNFAVPAILQVKVSPAEAWIIFNTALDTIGALKMSWPQIVLPLILIAFFARRGLAWPHLQQTASASLVRQQLGSAVNVSAGIGGILVCGLSAFLPVFQLLSVERTWLELRGALAAGQRAVWNSFYLSAGTALVLIGLSLALAALVLPERAKLSRVWSYLGVLTWLPFLLPGVLLGIALIAIFNRPSLSFFYQSAGIVILAFSVRYLAVGWTAVRHSLQTVDPSLTEAARLDGANRWQLLRFVHWPQISTGIAAAWYIVFLLCLWDVESMILIVPPGVGETLATRIFNLLHYGHNAQVNALCLMLLLLAVLPLLLWKAAGFFSRIMRHASVMVTLVSVSSLALLSGCSPGAGPGDTPIQSQLFSRVKIIGTRGVGVGQLNKPRSVAIDSQDNLFVVDMTGRVQKFSSNGDFILSWQMPQTDLGKPKGMCRNNDGDIVLVEPHYQRVNHFSTAGKLVAQWGQRGTNGGQFILPRAVAFDSQNEIFISEYSGSERVQRFKWNGPGAKPCVSFMNAFGKAGNALGDFNRPEGLCVDSQDRLYVADSCNHRIQVFTREGKFIRAYGKAGTGKGELSYPYDICVDKAGRQYVCEFGNSRIQIFDANDQPLEIIGGPGGEPGMFSNPWGVALDSAGNLYVADSQNHRVQKLIRKDSRSAAVTEPSRSCREITKGRESLRSG